jgi:hypothetical protein
MNLADPQSLNRYAYVLNDPVNFVDPLGLDPDDPIDPATGIPTPVAGPAASVDIPISFGTPIDGGVIGGIIGDTGIVIETGGESAPGGGGGGGGGSGPVDRHLIPSKKDIKKMNCAELEKAISYLRDVVAERFDQLSQDGTLPLTGANSIEGHQQQFRQVQDGLRSALNEYSSKGCGGKVPADAWRRASQRVPNPKPKATPKPNRPTRTFLEPGVLVPRPTSLPATAAAATLILLLLLLEFVTAVP